MSRLPRDSRSAALFLFPACLLLGVFVLWPLFQLVWVSLNQWNILKDEMTFVGASNYSVVLGESDFWKALANTLYYVAVSVPVGMVVSLVLALLLNEKLRAVGLFRTAVFTPFVTSTVAAGVIFTWLLDGDRGLVNAALAGPGLRAHQFPSKRSLGDAGGHRDDDLEAGGVQHDPVSRRSPGYP